MCLPSSRARVRLSDPSVCTVGLGSRHTVKKRSFGLEFSAESESRELLFWREAAASGDLKLKYTTEESHLTHQSSFTILLKTCHHVSLQISLLLFQKSDFHFRLLDSFNSILGFLCGADRGPRLSVAAEQTKMVSRRGGNATLPCKIQRDQSLTPNRKMRIKWTKLTSDYLKEVCTHKG